MKKFIYLLLILIPFNLFSQIWEGEAIYVDYEIILGDSLVEVIFSDTLPNKKWVRDNFLKSAGADYLQKADVRDSVMAINLDSVITNLLKADKGELDSIYVRDSTLQQIIERVVLAYNYVNRTELSDSTSDLRTDLLRKDAVGDSINQYLTEGNFISFTDTSVLIATKYDIDTTNINILWLDENDSIITKSITKVGIDSLYANFINSSGNIEVDTMIMDVLVLRDSIVDSITVGKTLLTAEKANELYGGAVIWLTIGDSVYLNTGFRKVGIDSIYTLFIKITGNLNVSDTIFSEIDSTDKVYADTGFYKNIQIVDDQVLENVGFELYNEQSTFWNSFAAGSNGNPTLAANWRGRGEPSDDSRASPMIRFKPRTDDQSRIEFRMSPRYDEFTDELARIDSIQFKFTAILLNLNNHNIINVDTLFSDVVINSGNLWIQGDTLFLGNDTIISGTSISIRKLHLFDSLIVRDSTLDELIAARLISYTFGVGLTESAGEVKLGGEFDENINIYSDVGSNRQFYIRTYDPDYNETSIYLDTNRMLLYNGDGNLEAWMDLYESYIRYRAQGEDNNVYLRLDTMGLRYESDYSTKWTTDRYIPDLAKMRQEISDSVATVFDTSIYHLSFLDFLDGTTGVDYYPDEGYVTPSVSNGTIFAPLNFDVQCQGKISVLDSITIFYYTDASGDDFDFNLQRTDQDGTITTDRNVIDIGNGETGNNSYEVLATSITMQDFAYWIKLDVNNTNSSNDVRFYDIRIKYHYE